MASLHAGDIRVQVFEPEGHLVRVEPLRPAPVPGTLQLFDKIVEPRDLVVAHLDGRCHVAHQAVQKIDVGGQVLQVEAHGRF